MVEEARPGLTVYLPEIPSAETPGRMVALLEMFQEKKAEIGDPKDKLKYWYERVAQLRGDEIHGMGYRVIKIGDILYLTCSDLNEYNAKIKNPISRSVAVVRQRLIQAKEIASMVDQNKPVDQNPLYLVQAATDKEGFFDFVNGGRAHILRNAANASNLSFNEYTRSVNEACYNLFLFRPPFSQMFTSIIESIERTVFPQVGLRKVS